MSLRFLCDENIPKPNAARFEIARSVAWDLGEEPPARDEAAAVLLGVPGTVNPRYGEPHGKVNPKRLAYMRLVVSQPGIARLAPGQDSADAANQRCGTETERQPQRDRDLDGIGPG